MQTVLYGKTLEAHVKIDVISKRLFDGVPVKPKAVFVDVPDLVASRRISGIPTAALAKANGANGVAHSLSQLTYDTAGNRSDADHIGRLVAALEREIDLVEPFRRVAEALTEALKEKPSK
jgi:hypothetical protein